jgi:hypothetical protein
MIEGTHFQNGYITGNISKAIEEFKSRLGATEVMSFEGPVTVSTPKGQRVNVLKTAFIWIGNLQYELIEPVSGHVDIYKDHLPDDGVRFHHICMRIDDWDDFRARVDRRGYPVVLESGGDELKFLYLDARDSLGHYLEYIWTTPDIWRAMGGR